MKRKVEDKADSYAEEEYWNQRYKDEIYYSWYFDYETLQPLLHKVIHKDDTILEIGCGDAPLILDMKNSTGHKGSLLTGIDFSENVIDGLNTNYCQLVSSTSSSSSSSASQQPLSIFNNSSSNKDAIKYLKMDARHLSFDSDTFTCVIDKGTCDAMLCDNNSNDSDNNNNNTSSSNKKTQQAKKKKNSKEMLKGYEYVKQIFSEMVRVLVSDQKSHIIFISHLEADSDDFRQVSERCILPILYLKQDKVKWTIDCLMFVSDNAEDENAENENNDSNSKTSDKVNNSATVYIMTSHPRRFTRSSNAVSNTTISNSNTKTKYKNSVTNSITETTATAVKEYEPITMKLHTYYA